MKNTWGRLSALVAVALLTLLLTPAASASARECSNANLKGAYSVVLSGVVGGLPFSALDLATSDGAGNLSGSGTVAFNGAVVPVTFTATYTVNADCSGTAAFDNGATENFVVIGGGREIMLIKTDNPSAVVTGSGKSLNRAD